MKLKLYIFLSVSILLIATVLRFYQFGNRAPFDWDQARDYKAVSEIVSGKLTMVGPVAKGDGGFLLGPLYYYLVAPGFALSSGNPSSLPITSIVLDISTIGMILLLFPKIWGRGRSLLTATIWGLSWFAIESSHISWNVAMLPLWTVLFLAALLSQSKKISHAIWLGILAGLSWHIHASLIPLSLVMVIIALLRKNLKLTDIIPMIVGYSIAILPLLIFDLRHAGFNYYLMTSFAHASSNITWNLREIFISVFARYGKNIIGILTGSSDLHLTVGIGFFLLSLYHAFFGTKIAKWSGIITTLIIVLVILLREPGFPEYYLGAAYLPTIIIFIDSLALIGGKSFLAIVGTLLVCALNLAHFTATSTPFSLSNKLAVVDSIADLNTPVNIHYDLVYGRDQGIIPLIKYRGIVHNKSAKTSVVISEKTDQSLFIDGELASEIGQFGGMRVAKHVVQ